MPLTKQSAFISQSPISVEIGGTNLVPFPPTLIIPAQNLQINGELVGTGRGKWVNAIDYYGSLAGLSPTSFTFSDLEGIIGNFFTSIPSTITSISAPNLVYIGGNLLQSPTSSLTTLNVPNLKYTNQIGSFGGNFSSLTTINIGSLMAFVQFNTAVTFSVLTVFDLSKLQFILASFSATFSVLTSLNFSSLIYVGGSINITAPLMTTLTMPTLGTWKACFGNISLTSIALNQSSVDNLLSALAYMDGANNTIAYSTGKTVTITGTSSAPSNLGSTTTAGSNFVGSGTTCTVSLASHGYSTGDVLRISGITTLTFANRYAVITVTNENQFTYTMSSPASLTGAGTATIVKAGASAKALVTRGVTLATN